MGEKEQSNRKRGELVEMLLREVVALPDMLFVMGKGPQAVMEAWVDSEKSQVSVKGGWVAVESESWHCHLDLAQILRLRFVEEPDPHDKNRRAFSLRFLGKDEDPLLMIFFGKMYDDSGHLIQARVARFRSLRQHYGDGLATGS